MHTVSVDLARRLQAAGLKWEPKAGDWATRWVERELVTHVAPDGFIRFNRVPACWVKQSRCLWLPTGDDCLEVMRARGLFPAVAAYPGGPAWPAVWGCWACDRRDTTVVSMCQHAELAEATGLALAEVLEGEKREHE